MTGKRMGMGVRVGERREGKKEGDEGEGRERAREERKGGGGKVKG